jgi:SpoIID/LytB domain protein
VQATAGQVVTFGGQPVTTYFFSTSGGETEDVQNSFVGSQPKPWLKAVDDPFDSVSPKHRWGPFRFTATQVQHKLHRYLLGRFKRIKVLQRGVSPRVVRAQVVGTSGVTNVTGPQLRSAAPPGPLHLGDLEGEQDEASGKKPRRRLHAGRADGGVSPVEGGGGARLALGGDHRPGAGRALGARRAPRRHALGRGD